MTVSFVSNKEKTDAFLNNSLYLVFPAFVHHMAYLNWNACAGIN